MSVNSRQALVGHIGGTFISLAIGDIDELTVENFALLSSDDFATPLDAIERYLKSVPRCPDKVGLAVAGSVDGDTATLSYRPWTIEREQVRKLTGAGAIHFVNDLEAAALTLPRLTGDDLMSVRRGETRMRGTRLLVSVGTGLGVAGLVWSDGRWVPVTGEGGHAALPLDCAGAFDPAAVFPGVARVSAGDLLCGDGLVALYSAVAAGMGMDVPTLTPPRVIAAGRGGEDRAALRTLEIFTGCLGAFARDACLFFGARGGVYLGGVIAPSLAPMLQSGRVGDTFVAAGAAEPYMSSISLDIIKTSADTGLRGAAMALAHSLPAQPRSGR